MSPRRAVLASASRSLRDDSFSWHLHAYLTRYLKQHSFKALAGIKEMLLVQPHDLKYLERRERSFPNAFSSLLSSFFFFIFQSQRLCLVQVAMIWASHCWLCRPSLDPFLLCSAGPQRDSSEFHPNKTHDPILLLVRVRVKTMLTPLFLATWSSVALQTSVALTLAPATFWVDYALVHVPPPCLSINIIINSGV